LPKPDTKTFLGSGKVMEIDAYVKENDINVIVFDDDLSPSQLRNLGKDFRTKRFMIEVCLILDIFHQRAQTAQAKAQVNLARYQYLLPRLTNMWSHLERQRGGTGHAWWCGREGN
jgi:GTP-binding protein HflX